MNAYTQASRAVFILQVPLVGVCFLACSLIRDHGLERPKEPGEEEEGERKQQNGDGSDVSGTVSQVLTPTRRSVEGGDDFNEKGKRDEV